MSSFRSQCAVTAALVTFALARPVDACAVCGAGDPTLNATGTERPFAKRLRLSGEVRVGGARVGSDRATLVDLNEQRLDVTAAYAPTGSLFLSLSLPLLHRDARYGSRARSGAWAPGDVDVRVKGFVLRSQRGSFTHDLTLVGGLRLPSAPVQEGPDGNDLVLLVGVRFPVLQALRGEHYERPIVSLGAMIDL